MVLLYNPISSPAKKPILPFSLLAIGSLLADEDYVIVDGNLEQDPLASLSRVIRERKTRILAVTVMPGPQLRDAVPISKTLKRRFPDLKIVWGGYFPTQHYETVLKSGFVDVVLRGHAEFTFARLVEHWRHDSGEPPDLEGLASYSSPQGALGQALPPLPDPEKLPDFPYRKVPLERYVRQTFLGRTISHHSSYGCPFFCNFCAVVNLAQGRWKAQSAERTASTVEELIRSCDATGIEFFDNNFFVDEARVLEFAERISHLGIRWWGEARIDTLLRFSESTWRAMSKSGLHMVFMGAESGSNSVLRAMNKGGTSSSEKTLEIAERMRRYGIIPEFSFILGNPPDPVADTEKTLSFIRRVKETAPQAEIVLYLYTPVPLAGTLYEEAGKSGFNFPESLEEWISDRWSDFSLRRSQDLPWVEKSLVRKIRNFEKVLNAYYPTSTDDRLTPARRLILKIAGGWRYQTRFFSWPWELRLLQKLFHYQRPETSGF